MRKGERPQEDGVDHAENSGGTADTEPEGQGGDRARHGTAAQGANGAAEILEHPDDPFNRRANPLVTATR